MATGATMTDTVNYSGMLKGKKDNKTRFLDSIYERGRDGGRRTTNSVEFVLGSGYDIDDPEQPEVSEQQSLEAPEPETTERDQDSNVVQIFHKSVAVSYMKQSDHNSLGGVNVAGAQNNVPDELDFQVGQRMDRIRRDLNYTVINGTYQYAKGSKTVAPKTRGLLEAIQTNRFDANGSALTKNMVNDVIMNSIANGLDETEIEIWVNPKMLDVITDAYIQIPGSTLPASRTQGGVAYVTILTNYGELKIFWDPQFPVGKIVFPNMGQLAIAEKPTVNKEGENLGVVFYEPLAKTGASEKGQLYGELGFDYASEWSHAVLENIKM